MIIPDDPHETTPPGWEQIVLRGGPFARQRRTIPAADDRLVLVDDDGRPQTYYRLNHRPELVHESIISAAFGGQGGAA